MMSTIHHERVMKLCGKIRALTADLFNDFSVKKFQETLQDRSKLLSLIRSEIDMQRDETGDDQISESMNAEFNYYLQEIRSMDLKVMSVIQSKMDEIRFELRGLSNNASAAIAYLHHKRG